MHKISTHLFLCFLALQLILGSYKGYVALYDKGSSEPRQIYPYKIIALPEQDQHSLAEGIPIRNEKHLQQLLEDYLS